MRDPSWACGRACFAAIGLCAILTACGGSSGGASSGGQGGGGAGKSGSGGAGTGGGASGASGTSGSSGGAAGTGGTASGGASGGSSGATGVGGAGGSGGQAATVPGTVFYVGGEFKTVGGQARTRMAAVEVSTGAVAPWNPGADGTVRALSKGGDTICHHILPPAALTST